MADVVPVARAKLVEIGDRTFERTLDRVPTKESLEFLAVRDLVKRFGDRCAEPLTAMLVHEVQRRDRARRGSSPTSA